MGVSVVIPAKNAAGTIAPTLESLRAILHRLGGNRRRRPVGRRYRRAGDLLCRGGTEDHARTRGREGSLLGAQPVHREGRARRAPLPRCRRPDPADAPRAADLRPPREPGAGRRALRVGTPRPRRQLGGGDRGNRDRRSLSDTGAALQLSDPRVPGSARALRRARRLRARPRDVRKTGTSGSASRGPVPGSGSFPRFSPSTGCAPNSAVLTVDSLLDDGLHVIDQGFAADPRVPNPASEHSDGLRDDGRTRTRLQFAAWVFGLMLGSDWNPRPTSPVSAAGRSTSSRGTSPAASSPGRCCPPARRRRTRRDLSPSFDPASTSTWPPSKRRPGGASRKADVTCARGAHRSRRRKGVRGLDRPNVRDTARGHQADLRPDASPGARIAWSAASSSKATRSA